MKAARRLSIILLVLCGTAPAVFPTPSDAVIARLEKALALLTTADAPTSYVISTTMEISDGRKKMLQTIELRERVTLAPGKPMRRETLSRRTTGGTTDSTSGASKKSEGSGAGSSWNVVFPVGKDLPSFRFGTERKEGSMIACDFAPAASSGAAEGLTRGTLLWDPVMELPYRLEAVPIRNPPLTSALSFSFVFATEGGFSYPATVSFSAEGGILFLRRYINSVSRITEFVRMP
jgi:hypothetical protein